ncbi:hypothetical protein [Pararhodospirillum oryzae]|uniref:Uncharacterized protein n=1 Tax=Pararhodospirillum oryzae TaxID=478448 RepID=A0A512H9L3_9PROT|nr:hypothetical protein [Pararhodospirillum oryzae]GEO82143.1 hypothetical protein ROR02_22740 [Pararhodospirillum oryzae]
MITFTEGDLSLSVPDGVRLRKFDDEIKTGLNHCMKAVDFVIDLDDRILFVELKDLANPAARDKNRRAFLDDLNKDVIDGKLVTKYRDSWLFEWAEGRANKPCYYFVLLEGCGLDAVGLAIRTDRLRKRIPLRSLEGRRWTRPFVVGCQVLTRAAWNRSFPDFPVRRLSEEGTL